LALCLWLGAIEAIASAGPTVPATAEKKYTGERISLDFQNADLGNVIRIISDVSGKKILLSENVGGKITLKLRDVPWDQALDIILTSQNLEIDDSGGILTVYDLYTFYKIQDNRKAAEPNKSAEIAATPRLMRKVFTSKYAPASLVAEELNKLKSERGKIRVIGNDLYIEDEPEAIAAMTQAFVCADRVKRQILIEARMVAASAAFAGKIGVPEFDDYSGRGSTPDATDQETAGGLTGLSDVSDGAKLKAVVLKKADTLLLNAAIKGSETSSEAGTISAPRIMAANDQEVLIKQGHMIGCPTGSSASTVPNLQFKDTVMEIKVKPHIEEDVSILSLDITLITDNDSGDSKEAVTKVTIKDGETVAIGSVFLDGEFVSENGPAAERAWPLADWLYNGRSSGGDQKSEMIIFITANIFPINI